MYWIARGQVLGNALASSSIGDPFKELWRKLWKANVLGKVRICVWRACCNLLPTRERLMTKGYEGDLPGLLCNHPIEDAAHLFCKCPTASILLSQPPFHLQHSLLPQLHFKEWMLEQAMHLKGEVFDRLLMLIWGLWNNRNTKLWENTERSSSDILLRYMTWLEEFQRSRASNAALKHSITKIWKPAEAPMLKLNMDVVFVPYLTKGGIGGILRNSSGAVCAAFQKTAQYVSSAVHIELLAIQYGLEFIKQHNYQSVCIETDCQLAVQDITSLCPVLIEYGPLIEDIQYTWKSLQQVQICFAPRTCNQIAHRLASLAFESEQCVGWFNHTPECIRDLVNKELPPPT